jgi:hypothetical protein
VHYNSLFAGSASPTQTTHRAWAAWNPQFTGDRYDATDPAQGGPEGGPVIDVITTPKQF